MAPIPLKLLVTIVDRGKGQRAADLYRSHGLHFECLCMGLGTASSKLLDYFGLAETEKDVVLTLIPAPAVARVIRDADARFGLARPGQGILFTVPLTGVGGQISSILCKLENSSQSGEAKEEANMDPNVRYDLILAVVSRGSTEIVMDAARSEGARGGTILHARQVGSEERGRLLGLTLQPEREIVVILTPRPQKHALMVAINKAAGLNTPCEGLVFSLPVDDMMGLQPPIAPGPAPEA